MTEQAQPQFTSQSLAQAWDATASAVQDLLTGDYPRGIHAADRTFLLKRSMEHLKAYLQPALGEMLARELAAQKAAEAPPAAQQVPAPTTGNAPATGECKDCPPATKKGRPRNA